MAEGGTSSASPVVLQRPEDTLVELESVPSTQRSFSCKSLHRCLQLQKNLIHEAQHRPAEPTLAYFDNILMHFLKGAYLLFSSLPGALQFDALEQLIARGQYAQPFLGPLGPDGSLVIGVPEQFDATPENISELCRLAAAGVVCYYHYTNFPHTQDSFPSDDAALLFTTMAIKSCMQPETQAQLTAELEAHESIMTLGEMRWLLHFLRANLSGLLGDVAYILGDKEKHKDQLIAQQADYLALIKAVPQNAAGFMWYARSCLRFQQMQAALLFASKGLVVADANSAHIYKAQLRCIKAVAVALGASGETFTGQEVRDSLSLGQEDLDKEKSQLPKIYHNLLTLDPEGAVLADKIVPYVDGTPLAEVPAMSVVYATQPPDSLPIGALTAESAPSAGNGSA